MFNAYPPSEEAQWFLEYVLFGFWWHPVRWFGWVLAASVLIWVACGAVRTVFYLFWRVALILAVLVIPAAAGWYDYFEPPQPPPLTEYERDVAACFQKAPWVDPDGAWKRQCVAEAERRRAVARPSK